VAESKHSPREWKRRIDDTFSEAEIEAKVEKLRPITGLSPLTLRVCVGRGLDTPESIEDFLSPKLEGLTNPGKIRDMERAVERLSRARAMREAVLVFGDYDVDGTTGAALLSWVFREMGFQYQVRQPDRFKDGYGLNVRAIEEAAQAGVKLVVTVDCGITSFDAAAKAAELGLDLIIVDHHQLDPQRGLPVAHAVLNPQRTDCSSELKQLCGCGLAFYLALGLRAHGRAQGWFAAGQEPNLKQHLDLVVIATAADMVPLVGDNHVLVRQGMEVLKHSRKPGVRALMETAGLASRDLSPGHLGFVLGPRINASGRMQSASLALELLTTQDSGRALELARELERLNEERAQLQNQIWDQVRARVEQGLAEGKFKHGIAVGDAAWHEGVVGIVASRVTETFRKPAAVIAFREGMGKGSVRSYGGKDVLAALRASAEHLVGFGGHKHAAGLSLRPEDLESFAGRFDQVLGSIEEDARTLPLIVEGECSMEELDLKTLQELERMGPFGPGNPEPVVVIRASVKDRRILKGRHLKLQLAPAGAARSAARMSQKSSTLEAIWFHAAEKQEFLEATGEGTSLEEGSEWAGVPELNRFRGQATPSFRVRDWRRTST